MFEILTLLVISGAFFLGLIVGYLFGWADGWKSGQKQERNGSITD